MPKEMLTATDLSPLLGVSSSRVYQMLAAGEIPSIRIGKGRSVRIPRAAWEEWLRERNKEAGVSVTPPAAA